MSLDLTAKGNLQKFLPYWYFLAVSSIGKSMGLVFGWRSFLDMWALVCKLKYILGTLVLHALKMEVDVINLYMPSHDIK